ncbi:MAG: protein-disulfide reductase DsbD family protein, partial [Bacteroidota bacterium]
YKLKARNSSRSRCRAQSGPKRHQNATRDKFETNTCFERIGKVTEPKPHEDFDSTFMVKVLQFDKAATFKQKVKLKGNTCIVKGTIGYQVCKEACILEEEFFEFKLDGSTTGTSTETVQPAIGTDSSLSPGSQDTLTRSESGSDTTLISVADGLEPGCGSADDSTGDEDLGYWGIFFAGLLGGLLALFTPCVFPMVPMTVSFFTKRSGNRSKGIRNALIYAVSIVGIYVSLGLLVTVLFGSDALNDLASNAFFNLAFFVIFVIFAISFFGAFEITLPSSFVNKADAASERGGLVGIFFMAFTLSLVSFSCTGPIIGTLLVEAAQGRSYLGPLTGMLGFSLALAVPFALFSLFPGWLSTLPKSGGWLNTIKVSLGFIELALALKFLSNVDLAYHWGILQRELFIVLWVVIFGMLGLYLLGKFRLSHDSEMKHIGIGRLIFALLTLSFCVYLIPGIWGAPLKLISGFPPPDFYKEWKTGDENDCPHDLLCFKDYEEGMKYAKNQGKPVMLDFTGWSCVNCRKMEDNVWSDPKVIKRLAEEYVLISLYVDDKTRLPEGDQYVSSVTGKKIRTTGNKWSEMQAAVYKTNSQPYYILLDNQGKILAKPRGYTPDVDMFADFLDEGLCRYSKRTDR